MRQTGWLKKIFMTNMSRSGMLKTKRKTATSIPNQHKQNKMSEMLNPYCPHYNVLESKLFYPEIVKNSSGSEVQLSFTIVLIMKS